MPAKHPQKPEELLKAAREKKGWTQSEVAEKLGIGLRMYQKYEDGQFPKYKREQISELDRLFSTNLYELIYEQSDDDGEDAKPTFIEQRRKKKQEFIWPTAPFMPVPAQAGYVKAVDHRDYMGQMAQYPLPPGIDPHGHIWAWWEVEGDSMYPEYSGGDMLLTSLVHPMDYENMRPHYAYVVVTDDKVLFKKVYHRNELEWVLQSVNQEMYPPQPLAVQYIKEVWVLRAHVRRKMPATKMLDALDEDYKNKRYPDR